MQSQVIAEQIIIAGIIVLAGVVGSRVRVIDDQVRNAISRLVFNITLPLLIVTTVSRMEMTQEVLVNGFWVIVFSALSFVLMYVFGKLSARLFQLPERSAAVHELHTMFGNIVFLGFPLIAALYPDEGALLYASIYYMVASLMQWTYAIVRLKGQGDMPLRKRVKNLVNPNTMAFVVGIGLFFVQFQIPDIVYKPLRTVGNVTGPLALIYIGATLAVTNLQGVFKRYDIYLLSFNKLLLIPFVLLLLINLVVQQAGIEFGNMAKTVVVLETAMPCMSMIVIMAKAYGADDKQASENVFLTTILSLATLPLMFYLTTLL